MRDIIFRAKRLDNGEWVEGYYIGEQKMVGKDAYWMLDINDIFGRFHYRSIVPDTLGQFTDLTDKNGKRIFEGDVCKINHHGVADIAVISFEHGTFYINPTMGRIREMSLWNAWYNDDDIEVVNNIYEDVCELPAP